MLNHPLNDDKKLAAMETWSFSSADPRFVFLFCKHERPVADHKKSYRKFAGHMQSQAASISGSVICWYHHSESLPSATINHVRRSSINYLITINHQPINQFINNNHQFARISSIRVMHPPGPYPLTVEVRPAAWLARYHLSGPCGTKCDQLQTNQQAELTEVLNCQNAKIKTQKHMYYSIQYMIRGWKCWSKSSAEKKVARGHISQPVEPWPAEVPGQPGNTTVQKFQGWLSGLFLTSGLSMKNGMLMSWIMCLFLLTSCTQSQMSSHDPPNMVSCEELWDRFGPTLIIYHFGNDMWVNSEFMGTSGSQFKKSSILYVQQSSNAWLLNLSKIW